MDVFVWIGMCKSVWIDVRTFISQCVRLCVCTVLKDLTCLLFPAQLHVLVSVGISSTLILVGRCSLL